MKKTFITLSTLLAIAFAGCTKEATDKASLTQSVQISSVQSEKASTTFSIVQNGDGTSTATLQPDSTNGQDAFVDKQIGAPNTANTNFNLYAEMDMEAWTVDDNPIFLRGYLRFVNLALIPSTAHVLSATLYLYGVSSSASGRQGNSVYPGSPYNSYGSNRCTIEQVKAMWDESTITWNNQPNAVDKPAVYIPKSTSQWNYDVALNVTRLTKHGIANPDKNFGVRISLENESVYRSMIFGSSEVADPARRPKLVVTYK